MRFYSKTYISDLIFIQSRNLGRDEVPAQVSKDECNACGACQEVCPENAIAMNDVAVIDKDKCVDCGACVDECPNNCIKLG